MPISAFAQNETGAEGNNATSSEASDSEAPLILPAGIPLNLIMQEELYSQRNREGDEIIFTLAEDVVLMGTTYLVAGTPVIGRVTHSRPSRSWGRSGNLDIEINTIYPLYSMPIPLSGESSGSGGNQTVTSVGATVLLGISVVGLLAGGAISGSGAVIPAGTSISVYTLGEGEIMDIPEDEMRAMVDKWLEDKIISSFLNYNWDNKKKISSAIEGMGFSIDELTYTIEPIEEYQYIITVHLSETQAAIFKMKPFEEPHAGKFSTLEAQNDLAEDVIRNVYR